jgi:hypothetical protein
MMNNKKNSINRSQAFIIVFALTIVSLMVYLTQQLVNGVLISGNFVSIVMQREQAKELALSGIQIVIKQLYDLETEDKKDDKKKKSDGSEEKKEEEKPGGAKQSVHDKKFFDQIFPFLNRWREFTFEEKRDGFDGMLRICLTSEEGKININEAFDFKKQEFRKEYAMLLKSLEIKDKLAAGELATKLQEFLTKRARKLEDVSELAQLPVCKNLNIFYQPPEKPKQKKEAPMANTNLTVSDIFTIWTESHEIDPLLFSDALCAMFTFRRPLATDPETEKKKQKQFKEQFKPEMAKDLDTNWEVFSLLYDKKPVFLKEMQGIFSKEFGPRTYSVISYATVGKVTQRVMAIVKKVDRSPDEKKPDDASAKAQPVTPDEKGKEKSAREKYDIKILRLYWL